MSSFIAICVKIPVIFASCHFCKFPNYFYLHLVWNTMSEHHFVPIYITIVAGQPEFESASPDEKRKYFHYSMWEGAGYGQLLKNEILQFHAKMLKKIEVHLVLYN